MCEVLEVSESGYYASRSRPPSKRALEDLELTKRIVEIHRASDGNYGAPNIHRELRDLNIRVGKKRVARLSARRRSKARRCGSTA